MTQTNVDVEVQPWCPIENTPYEGYCIGEFPTVEKRPIGQCDHFETCLKFKNTMTSYEQENTNHH